MDIETIKAAHKEASEAAYLVAVQYLLKNYNGKDQGACGFAWVRSPIDGRSKNAKLLKEIGFEKSYSGGFQLWNPANINAQNVDCKYEGASEYARIFMEKTGIHMYAEDRMD